MTFDQNLVDKFEQVLNCPPPSGRQKEQFVQDFMEEHSELVPIHDSWGHPLHFGMIISKYRLSTEYTTDYVYITKNSAQWKISFVELEKPEKSIFTKDDRFSADFNDALQQVNAWKLFLQENREEGLRRLRPLLNIGDLGRNPIDFDFHLVIGRSADKNKTLVRKRFIADLSKQINIITYDQVLDRYKDRPSSKKNIMKMSEDKFDFKILNSEPVGMFSQMTPEFLNVSGTDETTLKSWGYDIDAWRDGILLMVNGKSTLPSSFTKP